MERIVLHLGMFETLFLAVLAIYVGDFLRLRFPILRKYCLPASVIGGTLFALISLGLYYGNLYELNFDYKTINSLFYCLFFAASGAAASIDLLKRGGKLVAIFAVLAAVLAILQNTVALGIGNLLGIDPLIALMTGSIPMTGGHGNAASFAPLAVEAGAEAAMEVAIAAATFGLIAGCLLGGPFGRFLIKKYKFNTLKSDTQDSLEADAAGNASKLMDKHSVTQAVFLLCIALGLGQILKLGVDSLGIKSLKFPIHVWAMFGGILVRVGLDLFARKNKKARKEVLYQGLDTVGEFSLGLFVSMSIITMKLWHLSGLGFALTALLVAQVVLIVIFCYFLTFNLLGRNYDSAVMSVGHLGFGLGAVPVSMTTMQAVCKKYRYSKLAFFVVPVIGGFISNITNAVIITKFLDIAKSMAGIM